MDLFNRKALALAGERLSYLTTDLADSRQGSSELVRRIDTLLEERHELEVKNAVLTERLDLLTSGVLDQKPSPQAWGEEVEDADFLFRTGKIDRGEFEAILENAGFSNTEIEFDSGSLPRI
jgi:regulator of replication initiation timing